MRVLIGAAGSVSKVYAREHMLDQEYKLEVRKCLKDGLLTTSRRGRLAGP